MTLQYNQAGYGRAESEYSLYDFVIIKKFINSMYFDVKEQYWFDTGCQIDFFAKDKNTHPILIEIKNWFITIQDMQQIMKYIVHAVERYGQNNFTLIIIAGGIEDTRRTILDKLNVKIILTKDLDR